MSFSEDLREELAAIAPDKGCCRLAEISALFHSAGTWHLRERGALTVQLDLGSGAAARRAFSLLRELGIHSEIRTYPSRRFNRATRFQLHVELDDGARAVMREAGVISPAGAPLERPPRRVIGRSCCRGAYLRGALLGSGSASGPRDAQLEFRAGSEDGAAFLAEVAAAGEFALAVRDRGSYSAAYMKGGENIADLLAALGASQTATRLDEHGVVAATRAAANRLANADEGNLVRTARAAHVQLEAIRELEATRLPVKLQEIAELRTRHPTLPLAELARRCRPPISKGAAHHRMKMLIERAAAHRAHVSCAR